MLPDMLTVPASQALTVRNTRDPSLLWVHSGTATVHTARQTHRLSTGQGLWMPAGVSYTVEVDADSVAFPIYPTTGHRSPALTHPHCIELPASWSDWLIYQFARSIGYLRGATSDTSLLDLVPGSHSFAPEEDQLKMRHVPLPPMPSSFEAMTVARSLLQRPADPAETAEHASSVSVSVRTLQLQFLLETGFPFARWRTAVRVAAAAALMDSGHEIGWAGAQVGFATAAGFTKAFRSHTGMSPRQYNQGLPTAHSPNDLLATGFTELLLHQLRSETARSDPPPPRIPATKTWSRINDFHVLIWVYRGSARVTVGRRTRRLRRGDAIWLPAGVRNSITLPRGSLILPLGSRRGTPETRLPRDLVHRFADEAEPHLLHTFVANYSHLRPSSHDPNRITHAFLELASRPRREDAASRAESLPVHRIIRAVRNDPSDRRNMKHWAQALDVDLNELRRTFAATTGQTLSEWRSEVRMTEARRYLEEGLSVAQVSSKLGYASPSAFSTVFSRAHGVSPREYQRNGWQHTDERVIVR